MANMPAFQASDESSILSARTKEKSRVIDTAFFFGSELWANELSSWTSKASGREFENKEQGRKACFYERDAVAKHSLRPH